MSNLTNELKNEHKKILEVFTDLQKLGLTSNKSEQLLFKSKELILKHLEKEDRELYPFLFEKAKNDAKLKRTLNIYAKEMDKITLFVNEFYQKYEESNKLRSNFTDNLIKLTVILKDRIRREEIALYKAYDKYQN